jgi:hypothetical protein
MRLIWGFEQVRKPAAQWHDGQIAHGRHAQIARRAFSATLGVAASSLRGSTLFFPRRNGLLRCARNDVERVDCFAGPSSGGIRATRWLAMMRNWCRDPARA